MLFFVTCNHNIHYFCYYKLIKSSIYANSLKDGFPCSLCKKLSNNILCSLTNLNVIYEEILKGLNLSDENYNNFYNQKDDEDIIMDYQSLMVGIQLFFQNYICKSLKKDIIFEEKKIDDFTFSEIYNLILNDFDAFTIYYNNTSFKKEQIYIWKNILLSIRLLFKNKILNYTEVLFTKFKNIYKNMQELNMNFLNNSEINTIINEFIICLFILYDLDEENKNKIKNLFQNNFFIYIFAFALLKRKENNIEEFFTKVENKDYIQKIYDYFDFYFLMKKKKI